MNNTTAIVVPTLSPHSPPTAVVLPILAAFAVLLCIPPLIFHLDARNFAATILVVGVCTSNVQNFINPIIWPRDTSTVTWKGQGLCDLEVKLDIGISSAIVGAMASIFRQLAVILDTDQATIVPSRTQRSRTWAFEGTLCIGLPIYIMCIHYIVQPYRYWLMAVYGCIPAYHSSWPTIVLVFICPIIVCLVGTSYSALAAIRLARYRRRISSILSSSSSITKARYIRLFGLTSTLLLIYFPLSIYTIVSNLQYRLYTYKWSIVHAHVHEIQVIPYGLTSSYNGFDRWIQVGTGYIMFLFFGVGHEAVTMYERWLSKVGVTRTWPALRLQALSSYTRQHSTLRSPLVADHTTSQASRQTPTVKSPIDRELELLDLEFEAGTAYTPAHHSLNGL